MSLQQVQQSTFNYLSKLLEEEDETFCRDLSDLVVALLEKEDPQFDDISNDMEPFLKENTPLFMNWLKKCLKSVGIDFGGQEEIRENQEELEDIQVEKEEIAEKIKEPKKGKNKLVFEEVNSSQEQKKNRMKRFGLPVTEDSEPNKTRKLDNNLPTRNKAKPAPKKQEMTEITIDRPNEKPSPTILKKKDNLVFKVVPESVKNDHVVTKTNDHFTVSFANNAAVTTKLPQKCIFYPNCTKSDCPYLHPEIPCTTFPNCPYGANCRYVHPPCRFADRCTKPGCPYAHSPFAQVDCKNGFICPGKGVGGVCKYKHPLLACRFGIMCLGKGKGCLFSHATVCTYGANCKTPGCKFAHVVKEEKKIVTKQQHQQHQVNEEVDADVDVSQLSESLARTPPRDDTETNNT